MRTPKFEHVKIGGGSLYVIDDFLSKSETDDLALFFDKEAFTRTESDSKKTAYIKSWAYYFPLNLAKKLEVEAVIQKKIKEIYKFRKLRILRAYCNSNTYGDLTFTHIDSPRAKPSITALIYANREWKKDWGGETFFFNSHNDAKYAVTPRPGRLILFDAFIKHRTGIPQRHCYEARRTFVIKYRPEDKKKMSL